MELKYIMKEYTVSTKTISGLTTAAEQRLMCVDSKVYLLIVYFQRRFKDKRVHNKKCKTENVNHINSDKSRSFLYTNNKRGDLFPSCLI